MHDDNLQEKLRNWFNATGIPLEIEAARHFSQNGFGVEQSVVYLDPETSNGREIDALAYRGDHTGCFAVLFPVECKATGKPWVVLTQKQQYQKIGALWLALMSKDAREAMADHVEQYLWIYHSTYGEHSGGYALRQAFSGQDDQAYKACMSALKAAASLVADDTQRITFAVPTIVVDAPLYDYTETTGGEQQFKKVESSAFMFSAHIGTYNRSIIRIVSKESLPDYARKCRSLADQYLSLFEQNTLNVFRRGI